MRKTLAILLAVPLAFLAAAPHAAAATSDETQAIERTRQTLLYGIDSQVLEVVQRLSSTKDTRFTKELVTVLAEAKSSDVRKAVLGIFEDQGVSDGVETARAIASSPDGQPADLLIAAVHYLAAVKATGLPGLLAPLVDSPDAGVASASISALGKAGDASSATLLEGKLASPDFPDTRKGQVIVALGDLKDKNAVPALMAIAKNTDEDKIRRVYAADALGRIGDPQAVPVLKAMFSENDALVRAYAASALSRFGLEEVFPMLMQGLKDDDWKVREQCAKAMAGRLTSSQASTALPALAFKAQYDPTPQVRNAAIQALASMDAGSATDALANLYQTAGLSLDTREAAFKALAGKSVARAIEASQSVISSEWKSINQKTLEATARVLSGLHGPELKDVYVKLLGSTNASARAFAVRGIGLNGYSDLKARVQDMQKTDPSPAVKAEAARALDKL